MLTPTLWLCPLLAGWTIQTDLSFSSSYPGCTDAARAAARTATVESATTPVGGCKKMENPTCKGIPTAGGSSKQCDSTAHTASGLSAACVHSCSLWRVHWVCCRCNFGGCKKCHDETTYACDECCDGCSLAHDPTKGIGYCAAPAPAEFLL
jgi:hypothetical protein